jgi:hypothetical protein
VRSLHPPLDPLNKGHGRQQQREDAGRSLYHGQRKPTARIVECHEVLEGPEVPTQDAEGEHTNEGSQPHSDPEPRAQSLLASVVSALFCAHHGALERLGIDHTSAGLRISSQANPQEAFSYCPIDTLPGAVDRPLSEIVVVGGPSLVHDKAAFSGMDRCS